MGLIQTSRQSTGGGGGGSVNWSTNRWSITAPFLSGLILTLSNVPTSSQAVLLSYNGQILQSGLDFTVSGSTITINFADPVADYDNPCVFQAQYTY